MTKMQILIVVVIAAGFIMNRIGSARAQESAGTAWKLIKDGALILDVRTPEEFGSGHLDGALNIPYEQTDRLVTAIGKDKGKSVVVYCRSGRRSGLAVNALLQRGYTNMVNGGGVQALLSAKPSDASKP